AQRLDAAGLVRRPSLFALYLRATGSASEIRPGRHLLNDDLSPRALVRRMQRAQTQEKAKVVIPEGYTRFDIARRLQAARICSARAFLDATVESSLLSDLKIAAGTAEGYLFPATYDLPLDSDPNQVVTRMANEFTKRYERLTRDNAQGTETLRQKLSWGPAEIVTLASIVEKEAAVDEERPIIASVFLNRLTDASFTPKRLQSDPTSAYGCVAMPERISSCRSYTGRVTPEMNADDTNPYTTYRHEGLPPGPIANPGEKSLQAVLVPAETRHLYFVARGGGHHTFSDTYAQHNEAIRRNHGSP
ncbi:MAG: endolytic transglycosylase MltG, partial [Polyangiaceae bacterium]